MPDETKLRLAAWPEIIAKVRACTPARVLVERAGAAYSTATHLELRHDHAAARDAVRTELNMERDLGAEFIVQWNLFEVSTQAQSKDDYLLRPDHGRCLSANGRLIIEARCSKSADLQVVIGDGLSVTAVSSQVPALLPEIAARAQERGWSIGQPFVVRYCRVGVINDLGALLTPKVVILLIGERPGLATAESLSAYMAFRPRPGQTDAQRNLISNIHRRGVAPVAAAERIIHLATQMMTLETSGIEVKENTLLGNGA